MSGGKGKQMKIYDAQDNELMTIRELTHEDGNLVIRGKIFGAMPMAAKLTPKEARAAFKLLDMRTIFLMIGMLFRRG